MTVLLPPEPGHKRKIVGFATRNPSLIAHRTVIDFKGKRPTYGRRFVLTHVRTGRHIGIYCETLRHAQLVAAALNQQEFSWDKITPQNSAAFRDRLPKELRLWLLYLQGYVAISDPRFNRVRHSWEQANKAVQR